MPEANSKPVTMEDVIERLDTHEEMSVHEFFDLVFKTRFTGSYTVHCHNGKPRFFEVHQSVTIRVGA